jgi:hypothetical protein
MTRENKEPLSKEVSRLESEVGAHARHTLPHLWVSEPLRPRSVFRAAVQITPEA